MLNPKGVNLIRAFPGMGIRVWGARTASSDGSWKYVNVRRLFIYIEETIKDYPFREVRQVPTCKFGHIVTKIRTVFSE